MSLSAIDLCARALIKIGAAPLSAFSDPTAEAEVARSLYPPVRDALLSSHPWSFATAQSRLPRLANPPPSDFAFAYQLPPGLLRALSAGSGGVSRGVIYRITGAHLHSDAEEVVLSYIFRPADGAFPPYFDYLLIAQLAAEFCLPLTESTSRAGLLADFARMELVRARATDSQGAGLPPALEDFTLIGARR